MGQVVVCLSLPLNVTSFVIHFIENSSLYIESPSTVLGPLGINEDIPFSLVYSQLTFLKYLMKLNQLESFI